MGKIGFLLRLVSGLSKEDNANRAFGGTQGSPIKAGVTLLAALCVVIAIIYAIDIFI